jgi:hypothetical protein
LKALMNCVVYGNRSGVAAWECLAVSSRLENPEIQTLGEHAGYKGTNGQENLGRSRVTSTCRVRCKMRILPGWRIGGRSESSNLVGKQYLMKNAGSILDDKAKDCAWLFP